MAKTKKFIEETMQVVENDLDKIRTSPLMYISRVGSLGALHLAKECINNNECLLCDYGYILTEDNICENLCAWQIQ